MSPFGCGMLALSKAEGNAALRFLQRVFDLARHEPLRVRFEGPDKFTA